ncbi:mucin-5AC [Cucumis melo var. makuwa]|uniref:Mucin-5AC n=1 Tax=Cucumis melo var. makuwa TaxID=1194695 RepID=A0A5D3CJG7_CUCMM|nr:mucin-5AC [Cucumis melo var. makuwa]TYK10546.1 mucin-5AC [Cucumis melo var. makuwa]
MAGRFAIVLGFALFLFLEYSAAQTVYTVGDSAGWTVPANGVAFYESWAAGKTFHVGDSLGETGMDEVSRVTKMGFDICSDDNEIGDSIETGPATIPLLSPGEYYFISSEDRHCQQGQKLAINVTAAPGPRSPPSSSVPPRTPAPGRAPVTHVVGDTFGWGIPQGGAMFYANWTAGKRFIVGDSLVFNFRTREDDLVRVTKQSFDLCNDDGEIGDDIDHGPATIPLLTPGEYYFISNEDGHCQQGQKLAINVTAAAPGPMTPPSSNPPPSTPRPAPVTHIVGGSVGWTIPPGGAAFYVNWTAGKTFAVGDSLVFNFRTDVHDVERVPKLSFDICSDDNEIGDTIESGPATVVLTTPGEHYYISGENQDCELGQKLAINVVASRSTGPVTSISTPPTSGPTPGGSGRGLPNSSGNTIAAALSATVFGLVLSFF